MVVKEAVRMEEAVLVVVASVDNNTLAIVLVLKLTLGWSERGCTHSISSGWLRDLTPYPTLAPDPPVLLLYRTRKT